MKTPSRHSGFTLIEMLVVISIIGILVAIAMPTLNNLGKADSVLASTRQMLDDVARARQYAISQRTTVYMIFCPANFWSAPNNYGPIVGSTEQPKAEKLWGKQLNSYTFVTLRSVGEQPGKISPRYLQSWKTLPDGAIIAPWKFQPRTMVTRVYDPPLPALPTDRYFDVKGFAVTNIIPFPSAEAAAIGPAKPYVWLPYIAFNHLGQLTQDGVSLSDEDEFIPLARGSVSYSRDANKVATQAPPTATENPPGISSNAFTIVHIDKLTGRARLEKQEFR